MGSQQGLEDWSKETHTVTHCPHPRVLQEDQDLLILRNGNCDPSVEHVTPFLSLGVFFSHISSERIQNSAAGTQAWFAHFSPLTQRISSKFSALWTWRFLWKQPPSFFKKKKVWKDDFHWSSVLDDETAPLVWKPRWLTAGFVFFCSLMDALRRKKRFFRGSFWEFISLLTEKHKSCYFLVRAYDVCHQNNFFTILPFQTFFFFGKIELAFLAILCVLRLDFQK